MPLVVSLFIKHGKPKFTCVFLHGSLLDALKLLIISENSDIPAPTAARLRKNGRKPQAFDFPGET